MPTEHQGGLGQQEYPELTSASYECPLLLKHTAIPVKGTKDGKSFEIVQDRIGIQGEDTPDSGALP